MKKATYKNLQAKIQNTYIGIGTLGTMYLLMLKKFGTWYELRYALAVVLVADILIILKAKTFFSKRSNRQKFMKELAKDLSSEKGINI